MWRLNKISRSVSWFRLVGELMNGERYKGAGCVAQKIGRRWRKYGGQSAKMPLHIFKESASSKLLVRIRHGRCRHEEKLNARIQINEGTYGAKKLLAVCSTLIREILISMQKYGDKNILALPKLNCCRRSFLQEMEIRVHKFRLARSRNSSR